MGTDNALQPCPPRILSLRATLLTFPRQLNLELYLSQQIWAKEHGAYKTNLVMFRTLPALRKQRIFVVSLEAPVESESQLALEDSKIYDI